MSGSQINYRENYFQHPSLTKIRGDPTYSSLAKLQKECKANGKSVRSTLGGGTQGHLGLISSAIAYERVSPGVPFLRPALPVLPALENATQFQIAQARQIYDEQLESFKACNLIERTIVQQINTALDEDCLADLIDDDTGLLEGTIPTILQSLFDTYGAITPQSLAAAKAKVEATTYDHARPIVNLFTAINDYATMADAADAEETPAQLINIGLIIITRATIYSSDIRKWHDRLDADKTWPDFREHFKTAQKAIKRSQPTITTDSLGYHGQANSASLVDQVINRLYSQQDAPAPTGPTASPNADQQMSQHLSNSAQQNQAMLTQMQALASTMSALQTQVNNTSTRSPSTPSSSNNGSRSRTSNTSSTRTSTQSNRPQQPRKYCWTHGNCAHSGTDCEMKATGHIDEANYSNMQGGNNRNCHGS
jgi:hypothetical protein